MILACKESQQTNLWPPKVRKALMQKEHPICLEDYQIYVGVLMQAGIN